MGGGHAVADGLEVLAQVADHLSVADLAVAADDERRPERLQTIEGREPATADSVLVGKIGRKRSSTRSPANRIRSSGGR
jgi:hypothetical protein